MMKKYNPSQAPDSEEWLEVDESLRINLVKKQHRLESVEFQEGAEDLHALIHVIVENQLAMNVEGIPKTISKLTRQGLSRHESIHAIGAVLADDLFDILKNKKQPDMKKYKKRLEKLTAKGWQRGKW